MDVGEDLKCGQVTLVVAIGESSGGEVRSLVTVVDIRMYPVRVDAEIDHAGITERAIVVPQRDVLGLCHGNDGLVIGCDPGGVCILARGNRAQNGDDAGIDTVLDDSGKRTFEGCRRGAPLEVIGAVHNEDDAGLFAQEFAA